MELKDQIIEAAKSGNIKYIHQHLPNDVNDVYLSLTVKHCYDDMSGKTFKYLFPYVKKYCSQAGVLSNAIKAGNNNIVRQLIKANWFAIEGYYAAVEKDDLNLIISLCKVSVVDFKPLLICALSKERFTILDWLIKKAADNRFRANSDIFLKGIRSARQLDWLTENGYTFTSDQLNYELNLFNIDEIRRSDQPQKILNDNSTVIKWMHEHNYKVSSQLITVALKVGAVDVIKWAYELPSDELINSIRLDDLTLIDALVNGHIQIADWLHSIGIGMDIYKYFHRGVYDVIKKDAVNSIKWIHENERKYKIDTCHLDVAAGYCSFKIMDYLDSINIRGKDERMLQLIDNMDQDKVTDYVRWLYDHKYPVPKDKLDFLIPTDQCKA